MKIIISLSGKIGSGKDHICQHFIIPYLKTKNLNYVWLAFADYLKITCNVKHQIAYEDFYYNKTLEARKLLQKEGQEIKSNYPNFYVNIMKGYIKTMFDRSTDVILISDLRFIQELKGIKELEDQYQIVTIRLNAPKRTYQKLLKETGGNLVELEKIANNISEIELDNSLEEFDYVLDNDENGEIEREIETILKEKLLV